MEKSKSTKRALTASIISLLVCVTMLLGTTFAWFTDTATAGVNKIESGTLDIELQDETGAPLTEALKWVKAADAPTDEAVLWEPGASYDLQSFKVVNKGNLAVKYKIEVAGIQSGDAELLDALEFTFKEGSTETVLGTDQHLAKEAASDLITITAKMREDAGNEYQGKTVDGIMIKVVATQDTVEYDSNDNQYDKDATYPVLATATVKDGEDTVLKVQESDYDVTLTAPDGSVAENTTLRLTVETATTPENIAVEDTQTSTTYEVTLKDQNGDKVSAADGTLFTVEMNVGENREGLKVYHSGNLMTEDKGILTEAADHYVYDASTGVVTMKVDSFSPFSAVYNKEGWESNTAEGYTTAVDETNKVVTIANAEELALFAKQVTDDGKNYSGYTVNITADIDLGDFIWKPIKGNGKMSGITIDGQGHTIRNMLIRGCTNASGYGAGFIGDTSGSITIKNITFDKADVFFIDYAKKQYYGNVGAIVMGYTYGTTLFENVAVTNSEIWGYGKIGTLLGMGADPGVSVTFKNCVSKNNTIHGAYDLGGLAGMIQRGKGVDNGKVENCTVENITVDYDPASTYVDIKNAKATLKSDDTPNGTDVEKVISGKYLYESGYYWCCYGDYYVSYGHSSYDAPVEGYSKCLANSEYPVGK